MHFDFPNIYFGFLFESPLDRPIKSSKVRPTPVGTSRVLWDYASDTVWSSKSQSEQSCGLERQMKKKALLRNKKPGFHMWHRGNTKITNMTWQPYFFTIYHFNVAYFDRTVHVYQALIRWPTNMRNLKKKLRTTCGEVGRTATWHMWHVSIAHWPSSFWSLLSMPRGKN